MMKLAATLGVAAGIALGAVGVNAAVTHHRHHHPPAIQQLLTGDVTLHNQAWKCDQQVNMGTVTVTVDAGSGVGDAVLLKAGCTGYVAHMVITDNDGDPIHAGTINNLEIGDVQIHDYAHNSTVHQDGIQVLSATNFRVDGGYIGCYSCNDSQVLIQHGAGSAPEPTNVIFDRLTVDPGGYADPTCNTGPGGCEYTWGQGGAVLVSIGDNTHSSGFTHLTALSQANLHDLWQSDTATDPQWSFCSLPPPTRSNFTITTAMWANDC